MRVYPLIDYAIGVIIQQCQLNEITILFPVFLLDLVIVSVIVRLYTFTQS